MTYHLNPETGEPGLCRAKTKCPFGSEEAHHATPALAREAYEKSMATFETPPRFALADTVLKDANGEPLILHHGSNSEFASFDPDFTGKGNDSWGSGFYFSTVESVASGYGYVKPFNLAMKNPLRVDGFENMSLNNVMLSPQQALDLIKRHPSIRTQPDEDQNNPLADWSPAYWDREHHTEAQFDAMIQEVAKHYFNEDTSFTNLEGFYDTRNATAFRHALHEVVGWDGVVVEFQDPERNGNHVIAWFPEQIYAIEPAAV